MKKKYIIGIVSPYELEDKRASSGTMYMLLNAIKHQGFCIKKISVDYSYKRSFENRIKKRLYLLLSKIPFVEVDRFNIIGEAKAISDSLSSEDLKNCDVLFFPFESPAMYKRRFDKPVIYLSDATFQVMVNYYYYGYNYSEIKHGNEIEKYALEHSDAILFSSKWAADSAINDYHQDPSKVHVIEFGANIDDKDIIEKKFVYEGHLHLLFLGVDWKRKGGQIAVDACKWLNENGVPATLHIVGIRELDDSIKQLPYIDYVGFLNKNVPEQYSRLVQVIKQCQCMLLPTLQEAAGIAFCECSAYGLPSFSHLTGGTGNYIYNGKNGYLLPLGSTGADFGAKIKACLESGELESMSVTARDVYREKLNWNVWSQKVEIIIRKILEEKNGRNK